MIAPYGQCWIDPASPLYKLSEGDKVFDIQSGCFIYHQEEPFLVRENMKSCFYRSNLLKSAQTFPLWHQRNSKSVEHFTNTVTIPPGETVKLDTPILPAGELAARVGFEALTADAVFVADTKAIASEAVTDGTAPRPSDNLLLEGSEVFHVANCGTTPLKLAYSAFCS